MLDFTYQKIIKPVLFQFDPEAVHDWTFARLHNFSPLLPLFQPAFCVEDDRLTQTAWGLQFTNPIGLAAGFDKNAKGVELWPHFGFGFAELGTVTPKPQPGNEKPRLFRYPRRQAIVNRMGFNNDGAEAMATNLRKTLNKRQNMMTGISLGKQVSTPVDDAGAVTADYISSLEQLYQLSDFFVVNVRSPNTKNLRDLQNANRIEGLLSALKKKMKSLSDNGNAKPLCVKFAPDMQDDEIKAAVDAALNAGVDGILATNTTNRTQEIEQGGLSGRPLKERSTEVVALIARHTNYRIPLIGIGGIFTAEDAIEKLEAGAWLVQIYTGFIYQGPTVVKQILNGVLKEMDKRGYQSVSEFRPVSI